MPLRAKFKKHPVSIFMVAFTVAILVSLLAAPAFSVSSNQCSTCHGSTYNMQLEIVESSSQNIIPTSIQEGQTQTVTIAIENINNAPRYDTFSSVTVTLSSQNGHFSVDPSTYNIGSLSTGTAIATWKITGVSRGSDVLLISASAINTHEYLQFSDSYSPSPTIAVTPSSDPNYTPPPSPTPTSAPTPSPSTTASSQATPYPTVANSPSTTQTTPTSTNNPTPTPSPTAQATPTTQPSSTNASPTPQPNQDSTQPNPPPNHGSLDSPMLYIHPPLAIVGYVFVFLFAILVLKKDYFERRITKTAGIGLWLFTLLGLLTGMIWAQLSWGSYWSWDPKETMTLALFLAASAGQLSYFEKKYTATKYLALLSCALVVITGLSSFIIAGLHSYL